MELKKKKMVLKFNQNNQLKHEKKVHLILLRILTTDKNGLTRDYYIKAL